MDTDVLTIKAALAKLTNIELNVLVWATKNCPQVTPSLLAWLEAACNWELHRRVGVDYDLQSPGAAIPPGEAAASARAAVEIKAPFGKGTEGVGAMLDVLVRLLTPRS